MTEQREYSVLRIAEIIERLRGPGGCSWDRRQEPKDVGKYMLDEVYEVIDAIDEKSPDALKEELGDVLFQILFLSKMAEEKGNFTFHDVVSHVSEKMIIRHPHVFERPQDLNVEEIKTNWERIKSRERGRGEADVSPIDDVPRSMPLLMAAHKITARAARRGFDWDDKSGVLEKIEEELSELKEAIGEGRKGPVEEEIGDMFLSLVNLCRFTEADPQEALRCSLRKFVSRYSFVEQSLREKGLLPQDVSIVEMDILWDRAKEQERGNKL